MIRALGNRLSRFAARWVPDPFAIALGLTVFTFLMCLVVGLVSADALSGSSFYDRAAELVGNWGGRLKSGELLGKERGFWALLTFGMQMCLILVTGYALASSGPVQRLIARVAQWPRTPGQAVALTALVAMSCALLNWGLGLIVGALFARNVAVVAKRRGMKLHYPLVGAAGYTGLLVWHGGLSGSAPLKVTQAKDLAEILKRTDVAPVALGQTVFSTLNLVVTVLILVGVPLLLALMLPAADEKIVEIDDEQAVGADSSVQESNATATADARPSPAERFERSRLLAWLIAAMALGYLVMYLRKIGVDRIDLNAINLAFLALGLVMHGTPLAYGQAIGKATRSCAGIILQFPFYAGIMGMMALSGMVGLFAEAISQASGPTAFAPLTFLSAGLVNLFVPSGGGQWAVQGPLVVQAADNLGVPLGKTVMALAYGDQWTNMLQPFWALPLLGITGLKARQIIGYTAALMLLVLPIFIGCLLLF